MKKGQRKYNKEFVVKSRYAGKSVKHMIEVDFIKLGAGLTRRLAFTTILVNMQSDIRLGVCSELMRECIQRGAVKLSIK